MSDPVILFKRKPDTYHSYFWEYTLRITDDYMAACDEWWLCGYEKMYEATRQEAVDELERRKANDPHLALTVQIAMEAIQQDCSVRSMIGEEIPAELDEQWCIAWLADPERLAKDAELRERLNDWVVTDPIYRDIEFVQGRPSRVPQARG